MSETRFVNKDKGEFSTMQNKVPWKSQ